MTFPLVIFLIVILFPLFASTWRVSLLGLGLQGLLLAWMASLSVELESVPGILLLADLLLLRGILAPAVLYAVLERQKAPRRNDVIPANLLFWTLAGALILMSFRFAKLEVFSSGLASGPGEGSTQLAVSTAALLLGLLVLATRNTLFSQTIGVLRIENAIVLFEVGSPHHLPVSVQLGLSAVYGLTVLIFSLFLRRSALEQSAAATEGASP
jgi:hydrogenase-4 membrane subunit HyfE